MSLYVDRLMDLGEGNSTHVSMRTITQKCSLRRPCFSESSCLTRTRKGLLNDLLTVWSWLAIGYRIRLFPVRVLRGGWEIIKDMQHRLAMYSVVLKGSLINLPLATNP